MKTINIYISDLKLALLMEQLYKKFKSLHYSVEDCVKFYNDNAIIINNVHNFNSEYDLLAFADIYYGCMFCIIQKGQYNKAIDSIKNVLPVLEGGIDKYNVTRATFSNYVWLLWQQGIAYYNLRDYAQSIKLFNKVNEYEPANDKVKEWLEWAKWGRVTKFIPFLTILGFIGVMVNLFGKTFIPRDINLAISIVSVLILLSTLILNIYFKRKRLKKKSN